MHRSLDPPLWRSLLRVPAHRPDQVAAAHVCRADGIVLDLEALVPAPQRAAARKQLAAAIDEVGRGGADVLVRINNQPGQMEADLEAMEGAVPDAIVVPGATSGAQLRRVGSWLDQRDGAGAVRLLATIESARGLLAAADIAEGDPRVVALTLASERFANDVGMQPDDDTLRVPQQLVVLAARSNGLLALGLIGRVADQRDLQETARVARRSRRFGFEGAPCAHPAVVPVLNSAFSPDPEQVSRARHIVERHEDAIARGLDCVEVDGHRLDPATVDRARAVLARHARVVQRDAL